jgi:hypothetical protein
MMDGDINVYCDESTHLQNDGQPFMVLGAVVSPVALTKQITHRLVELRVKHGFPRDFEIKWNKVSAGKLDFYLDVVDYFFDDDDLEFRAVVATKSGLDHAKFGQSHDSWYYKMMFYLVRNVVSSTAKSHIYLDKKDTRGGIKVAKLHDVIANSVYDFDRRKIRRVQIVESHHVGLMQLADLLLGAVNYANRGLETSDAKLQVVERIRERSGIQLTHSTVLSATKFNIFCWQPHRTNL